MNWADLQTTWNDAWAGAYERAQALYRQRVSDNVEAYRAVVEGYIATLDAWRSSLERSYSIAERMPATRRDEARAWLAASADRYFWYGAGFWPSVQQRSNAAAFQGPPVALLVGIGAVILVVGVAAIAWAVATSKSADADFKAQEAYEVYLEAWRRASDQGATPPAPPPAPDASRGPDVDVAATIRAGTGLVIAAGAVFALWAAFRTFGGR